MKNSYSRLVNHWALVHKKYPFHHWGRNIFLKCPRELKAAERYYVRVRRSAWHRVISASGAARDNNRTWESISITTRKENGPVSAGLPDGSWTGRGQAVALLARKAAFRSLCLTVPMRARRVNDSAASRERDAAPCALQPAHTQHYCTLVFPPLLRVWVRFQLNKKYHLLT